jgi:hypothetical protein
LLGVALVGDVVFPFSDGSVAFLAGVALAAGGFDEAEDFAGAALVAAGDFFAAAACLGAGRGVAFAALTAGFAAAGRAAEVFVLPVARAAPAAGFALFAGVAAVFAGRFGAGIVRRSSRCTRNASAASPE